ncbi:hypothetical protein AX16_010148 [Volvariella volvacea WC 439]|nr:hypothetical protein AX16_010148 [Volvariella volvacea WC 439]
MNIPKLKGPPPRVLWPVLILLGHSLLLFIAWGFYTATAIRPVALRDSIAEKAARYSIAATFTVTLNFRLTSGSLYTHSVRYAVTCSLAKSMPLHRLALGIKIARAQVLLTKRAPFFGWMVLTLISVGILKAQTAAWNALFAPRRIIIEYGASGTGINMIAPEFAQLAINSVYNASWTSPDSITTIPSIMEASGIAALNAAFGHPGIVNFDQVTFINSTHGIMPVYLQNTQSSLRVGSQYPISLGPDAKPQTSSVFSTSIIVEQQGLTADVECQPRDQSLQTIEDFPFTIPTNATTMLNAITFHLNAICPEGSNATDWATTRVYDRNVSSPDVVLVGLCSIDSEPQNYEIILHGQGNAGFIGTLRCLVKPKVTTVQMHYASSTGIYNLSSTTFVTLGSLVHEEDIKIRGVGDGPLAFLYRHLKNMQTLAGNEFSNIITGPYRHDNSPQTTQRAIEAYLIGTFEFGATLLRAEFSRTNTPYWQNNQIPVPYTYEYKGTYFVETMGWDNRASVNVPLFLLIPTFVSLAAIVITISAIVGRPTAESKEDYLELNLGEFLHVLAVSYPGINLPSLDKNANDFLEESRNLSARLEPSNPETNTGRDFELKIK